jgi:hypothetical protein
MVLRAVVTTSMSSMTIRDAAEVRARTQRRADLDGSVVAWLLLT